MVEQRKEGLLLQEQQQASQQQQSMRYVIYPLQYGSFGIGLIVLGIAAYVDMQLADDGNNKGGNSGRGGVGSFLLHYWHLFCGNIFVALVLVRVIDWIFSYHVVGEMIHHADDDGNGTALLTATDTTRPFHPMTSAPVMSATYTCPENGIKYRTSWYKQYGPTYDECRKITVLENDDENGKGRDSLTAVETPLVAVVDLQLIRGFPQSARPCVKVLNHRFWCSYFNPFCKGQQLCWILFMIVVTVMYIPAYWMVLGDDDYDDYDPDYVGNQRMVYFVATVGCSLLVWTEGKYTSSTVLLESNEGGDDDDDDGMVSDPTTATTMVSGTTPFVSMVA